MSTLPSEPDKSVDASITDPPLTSLPDSAEQGEPAAAPENRSEQVTDDSEVNTGEVSTASGEAARPEVAIVPHKLRRRHLVVGAAVLVIGSVAASIPFFKATTPDPSVEPPPTDAERFAELLKQFQQSNETVFRCDALLIEDEPLRSLTDLERLTSLHVQVNGLTPLTASRLGSMPHLEELHLRGSQIDDEMLKAIATSQTLRVLNLPNCIISPEAIESLRAMPALRNLRLGIKQGTNQHARAVASISRLRAVHLIGVAVTDEGLQSLAEMRALESLYLDDTAVTDAGWLWLFENYPELHVHIDQLHHDRDPQKH